MDIFWDHEVTGWRGTAQEQGVLSRGGDGRDTMGKKTGVTEQLRDKASVVLPFLL